MSLDGEDGKLVGLNPGKAKTDIENINAGICGLQRRLVEITSTFFADLSNAWYYEHPKMSIDDLTQNLTNAVCKDTKDDLEKLKAYFNTVVKLRAEKVGGIWKDYYTARKYLK